LADSIRLQYHHVGFILTLTLSARPFSAHRFFYVGLTYSWGIIQAKLASEHLAPDSTLAFIGSTSVAFISFTAIINTRLIRLLGTRNVALLACSLLGIGQVLSGWTTKSVSGLFVTNGVIMGFGCSLCFMVSCINRGRYKYTNRYV
jgi:hypothetical protein